jgi:hypothetical protein
MDTVPNQDFIRKVLKCMHTLIKKPYATLGMHFNTSIVINTAVLANFSK